MWAACSSLRVLGTLCRIKVRVVSWQTADSPTWPIRPALKLERHIVIHGLLYASASHLIVCREARKVLIVLVTSNLGLPFKIR